MTGVYNFWLVALAYLVAAGGFYVLPKMTTHIRGAEGASRRYWLCGGGVALGAALWSSSFIGMLAYRLPIPMAYHGGTIASSFVLAVLASALTLTVASNVTLRLQTRAGLAVLAGAGFGAMQYIGIEAMQVSPAIVYAPESAAAALLLFLCADALAMASARLARPGEVALTFRVRAGAAAVIGAVFVLAISISLRSAELSDIARSTAQSRQASEAWMAMYILDPELFRFMVALLNGAWDASLAVATAACTTVLLVSIEMILMFDARLLARTASLAQTNVLLVSEANEKQQAEQALRSSVEELKILGSIGQLVNSSLEVTTVLSTIITQAVHLSKADAGTIYEYDGDTRSFVPRANFGVSEEMIAVLTEARILIGETVVGQCGETRAPVQVADLELESDYRLKDLLNVEGIRAIVAVPLLREERTVGALAIRRKTVGGFSPHEVELLQTVAAQSVVAIHNARLFHEVREKGQQLQAASQLKSQFLANMSHELRTPMNAIIGVSEMLLEDARELERADDVEPLERILRAAKHLLALINDILDLSKIEAGKMDLNLESVALQPLIEDVAATMRPIARKNGNVIEVSCAANLGFALADPIRLRQALLNLASNAAKFTDKGLIQIMARRSVSDGVDWTLVDVVDTGIGMTPGQLERLFQDFVQADASTTRKYGGTGLGLAISQRFCRMMGGDITVKSKVGEGSVFTIRIPAAGAKAPQPLARAPRASPVHGVNRMAEAPVLVIDDDETVRELMVRHLTREGFEVVTAENGIAGLALARQLHPSAITLDVMMPQLDGWTVLSALKGDPTLSDIPVVLVSIIDDKRRGYTLGATEYLVKPVQREALVSTLRTVCGIEAGRLLLVEDDDVARLVLAQTMEREGWTVEQAGNGRIGLDKLAQSRPDAIILDLMMPEMDGFEFLSHLRARGDGHDIPVVVITALDLSEEDQLRLNGRVAHVIYKSGRARDEVLQEVVASIAHFVRLEIPSTPTETVV